MARDTPIPAAVMQTDYWDGEGGRQWAAAQKQMDAVLAPFADAIFDAAAISEGDVVVDVGCGCGATTLAAARLVRGGRCLGVDVSGPMLEVARREADVAGLETGFERADAAAFSLDQGSVDVVVSRFGTMFFDDPRAAFENFRNWLRPGGSLVTTVWNRLENNPWVHDVTELVGRHVELSRPSPGSPGPFVFADAKALGDLLRRAGFAYVEQTDLDLPMRVEGSRRDALRFYEELGVVTGALDQVGEGPIRNAILADLEALVDAHHDGQAMTLGASARLVVAALPGETRGL